MGEWGLIKRLSKEEKLALWRAMDICRNSAPITPDMLKSFEGLTWNGVPTTAILQAYSICTFQRSTASYIRRHALHVVYSILNLVQ